MKIIGIIPARYGSTRLPGKPLADICGKPMIWWVYNNILQSKKIDEIFVATDDQRIVQACESYGIPSILTSTEAPNHFYRIWEASEKIHGDYYVSINGDEPLISYEDVDLVLDSLPEQQGGPFFKSGYRELTDPAETLDLSNVKIVLDVEGNCVYQSRNPIPSTKGSINFRFKKAIGIECFNKEALDFYVKTNPSDLELIEDIDHLRFISNGIKLKYVKVNTESLSVDTSKDLERVRQIISKKMSQQ